MDGNYAIVRLDALIEWNLCLLALILLLSSQLSNTPNRPCSIIISHYIVIMRPFGRMKLSLKILSGNIIHGDIFVINNDMQLDMTIMRLSLLLF